MSFVPPHLRGGRAPDVMKLGKRPPAAPATEPDRFYSLSKDTVTAEMIVDEYSLAGAHVQERARIPFPTFGYAFLSVGHYGFIDQDAAGLTGDTTLYASSPHELASDDPDHDGGIILWRWDWRAALSDVAETGDDNDYDDVVAIYDDGWLYGCGLRGAGVVHAFKVRANHSGYTKLAQTFPGGTTSGADAVWLTRSDVYVSAAWGGSPLIHKFGRGGGVTESADATGASRLKAGVPSPSVAEPDRSFGKRRVFSQDASAAESQDGTAAPAALWSDNLPAGVGATLSPVFARDGRVYTAFRLTDGSGHVFGGPPAAGAAEYDVALAVPAGNILLLAVCPGFG